MINLRDVLPGQLRLLQSYEAQEILDDCKRGAYSTGQNFVITAINKGWPILLQIDPYGEKYLHAVEIPGYHGSIALN